MEVCKENKRLIVTTTILALITYTVLFFVFFFDFAKVEEISYNEFLQLVGEKRVDTIYYSKAKEYMTITLYNDDTKGMTKEERDNYHYTNEDKRKVLFPGSQDFRENMLKADVNMVLQNENQFLPQLGSIILIVYTF